MSNQLLSIEKILPLLQEAPPRIAALTTGLKPAQLKTPPTPDEWSANDILAYLRACSDVWGGCIARILSEDKPAFRHVSPRSWMRKMNYLELEFQSSLHAFTAQRNDLLQVLGALKPKHWSRTAQVSRSGKVVEQSVQFYAESPANHEGVHLIQLGQIVSSRHK